MTVPIMAGRSPRGLPSRLSRGGKAVVVEIWILALLALAGCARDPLAPKVRAETPEEFFAWHRRTLSRQPQAVAEEFNEALTWIVAESPSKMALDDPRMMNNKHHPICRLIDGRTLRQVILQGYELANQAMLRAIIRESDQIVMVASHDEQLTRGMKDTWKFDRVLTQRRETLAEVRARVERNRRRIEALTAGGQ